MFSYIKQRIFLKYFIAITIFVPLVFIPFFFWISHRQEEFIMGQVRNQAMILHKQILHTRQWVADHNHVLIAKTGAVRSNPLLNNPDMEGLDGITYTKITPAILTRKLSNYAKKTDLYSFNITNIDGLNPTNHPDEFETSAINTFRAEKLNDEPGTEYVSSIEVDSGHHIYRFAAPLMVDSSCVACHLDKLFNPGDISGCISVSIPIDAARTAIKKNSRLLFYIMFGLTGLVVSTIFIFAQVLIFEPIQRIRIFIRQMQLNEYSCEESGGDELKEFADFIYLLDKKLKKQHLNLKLKIEESTLDLSHTNQQLTDANRELTRLNEAKNRFFSDISHEIRTPLTSIKGAADILSKKNSCNDPDYLAMIQKNTDHLVKLIVDLLDYAKLESGQPELTIKEQLLRDIVEDALTSVQPHAQIKDLNLICRVSSKCVVPMDAQRIFQVLTNLLTNAIRFSPKGAKIVVSAVQKPTGVEIMVKDCGSGIPQEYHTAIFEKFFQVPPSNQDSDNRKGSSGIGLAICKRLIEAHNGFIYVKSHPDHGSRFIFFLPLHKKG